MSLQDRWVAALVTNTDRDAPWLNMFVRWARKDCQVVRWKLDLFYFLFTQEKATTFLCAFGRWRSLLWEENFIVIKSKSRKRQLLMIKRSIQAWLPSLHHVQFGHVSVELIWSTLPVRVMSPPLGTCDFPRKDFAFNKDCKAFTFPWTHLELFKFYLKDNVSRTWRFFFTFDRGWPLGNILPFSFLSLIFMLSNQVWMDIQLRE